MIILNTYSQYGNVSFSTLARDGIISATISSNIKSELDIEVSSRSFLGDLGPPIRRYPYNETKQFLETVKMELDCQEEKFGASEWVSSGIDARAQTPFL